MSGTYEEKLSCGGNLKVTALDWEISYYFPGPDSRYRGTFFSVQGKSVPIYIDAFRANMDEFEKLKEAIPLGGEFSKKGKSGMTIRIGGFNPGVCIESYHMPISTRDQMEKVIASYEYAIHRGEQIKELLRSLPSVHRN